jgi:hypothetical protein
VLSLFLRCYILVLPYDSACPLDFSVVLMGTTFQHTLVEKNRLFTWPVKSINGVTQNCNIDAQWISMTIPLLFSLSNQIEYLY